MGIQIGGINGPFSGKVGTAVGSSWRGKWVLRAKPQKRTSGFSPLELRQQAKFSLMNKFLHLLLPLLNRTFQQFAIQMTGYNKAFSYNVKNAITGDYPDLKIDYSMVLLGRGDLPNAESPAAISTSPGKLDLTWKDNSGKGKAIATDKAFVAVYEEKSNLWDFGSDLAVRSAGAYTMDLTEFNGKTVQAYLGFISADEKEVTDTVYIGAVNVQAVEKEIPPAVS